MAPYVWTHQYTLLSPTTCFVVDDGTGKAVGYCIGCADIPSFNASYGTYVSTVLDPSLEVQRPADMTTKASWHLADGVTINEDCLAQMAYDPHRLLVDGNADLLATHRGTMHIDLLDEWQGKGWGRKLIERFVEAVRTEQHAESKGVWIGVAGDNSKVVQFYERVGFRVVEREVKSSSISMVKDI